MSFVETLSGASVASAQAERNWQANREAIGETQPWVLDACGSIGDVRWIFGRDGFLTAQDAIGHWWSGCSLPKRAAQTMLKKLDLRGVVGCLLAPTHAGQVAAALEKLSARQAVVVVQPDEEQMGVMLGCCDFSAEMRSNRLWFATGAAWAGMLGRLFEKRPGLSTPSQFIRTPATADDVVQRLIPIAERAFNQCNERRAIEVNEHVLRRPGAVPASPQSSVLSPQSYLILAASHFRLWDDAGTALLGAVGSARHLDPDDPAQSSALGLAMAARDCGAVIVPNRSRGELPQVLGESTRVISWITQPRVPAFDAGHAQDGLVVADESWIAMAQGAGWPADRVRVAGWPTVELAAATERCAAMIADTFTLETPVKSLSASSQHLLWELIRNDLASDPFSLGSDVNGFITRRMHRLEISEEGFDRSMFIEKLVIPAYQQGLVRVLLDAGVPLKIFGEGWDALSRVRAVWHGTVRTREAFWHAAESASVLIYPWPVRSAQQIDALGRAVVFPKVGRAEHWVREVKAALAGAGRATTSSNAGSLAAAIVELLGS